MHKHYTRVCNFYYGAQSKVLIKNKKSLPLNGSNLISFDQIEIVSRKSKKRIFINKIDNLPKYIKKKIKSDIKKIIKKKKN